MPVTTSYPGIYIEELPSNNHSVTAAPTSITVFVGYTNPFWRIGPLATLPPFGSAVLVQSFADYQANFGGFFTWPWLPDHVGQAVAQFFENGGAMAYVVALAANDLSASPPGLVSPASAELAASANPPASSPPDVPLTFVALQPVGVAGLADPGLTMSVTLSNLTTGSPPADPTPVLHDTADLTIVYGTRVETYRRVLISSLVATLNAASALVTVTGTPPDTYDGLPTTLALTYTNPPTEGESFVEPTDFAPVFAANAPLDKVAVFNLMVLPGITDPATLAEALAYCERKRAFFIMDPPADAVADELAESLLPAASGPATPMADIWNGGTIPVSTNGALYFPFLQTQDPVTGDPATSPPSGFVAGIFANEDANRGVWKSPAGLETTIKGTTGVTPWGVMTDPQQGILNPLGVNCLRTFAGIGTVVFGARTLVSANTAYEQWKYVAVRRMALFLEQSLYSSLGWAIFEPNAQPLWTALTQEVQAFMLGLYRQGAFQGATASKAFSVQCDDTTTTPADIDQGQVNVLVGFAPLKPAEFVVVQIQQLAGQSQS